jgi:CRP-like cAMP-binding protein
MENGQSMLVRFYQHFQVMGDVELFLESPAISSVQAITPVRCLGIPMEMMKLEVKSNNALLNRLGRALARKLESFNITSAINQNYPLETRLASYLSVIYPEYETSSDKDELETENLEEMAEFLGCSYRHLTRTLKALNERGIIEKTRSRIRILDPAELNKLSRDLYV